MLTKSNIIEKPHVLNSAELRTGNFLYDHGKRVIVDAIDASKGKNETECVLTVTDPALPLGKQQYCKLLGNFMPIVINGEWLFKAYFVLHPCNKEKFGWSKYTLDRFAPTAVHFVLSYGDMVIAHHLLSYENALYNVKYFHQLQNHIYILSGRELEYNRKWREQNGLNNVSNHSRVKDAFSQEEFPSKRKEQ